jgi:hypothetical protein
VAAKTYTIAGLNRALRKLGPECSAQLRDASILIAQHVADAARDRAIRQPGPAHLVAPSIKARRDRVPVVVMGSAKRLPPRGGKPRTGPRQLVRDVMWGAEFGGKARPTTQQFATWRGSSETAGYFLYPAVRAHAPDTGREYSEALDAALQAI